MTLPSRRRSAAGIAAIAAIMALLGITALLGALHGPAPTPTTLPGPVPTPTGTCGTPAAYLAERHPSPCLTPGAVATSDPAVICVKGYASRKRAELSGAQWTARRREVLQRYGLAVNPGEIDHLLPLSGGGANSFENLWPESTPQYQAKDKAEAGLHAGICKPGVTAAQARALQEAFIQQWGGSA